MASSWGNSWGLSWGNSWDRTAVVVVEQDRGKQGGGKRKRKHWSDDYPETGYFHDLEIPKPKKVEVEKPKKPEVVKKEVKEDFSELHELLRLDAELSSDIAGTLQKSSQIESQIDSFEKEQQRLLLVRKKKLLLLLAA